MKRVSGVIMAIGAVNIILSLIQGFLIPGDLQVDFSTPAKDYFLMSAVIFVVGLRMNQNAKRLEEEMQ